MAASGARALNTDAVYLICLVHLIICFLIIGGTTVGDRALTLGGVQISATLQWLNATFNCISIVSIIAAAVGLLYVIESHLDAYWFILLVGVAVDVFWLAVFAIWGRSCTHHGEALTAAIECEINTAGIIAIMVLLIIFKVCGLRFVSNATKRIRGKYNDELLPFMKEALNQSLSMEREVKNSFVASRQPQQWVSLFSNGNAPTMGRAFASDPSTMYSPMASRSMMPQQGIALSTRGTPGTAALSPRFSTVGAQAVPSTLASVSSMPVPSTLFTTTALSAGAGSQSPRATIGSMPVLTSAFGPPVPSSFVPSNLVL